MNKLIVAQINADMRNGIAHETEEHQITRKQFLHLDATSYLAEGIGTVRERHAFNMIENVSNKAAAIETALGADATSAVGNTFMAERILQQALD